jgi:hypothetical protein
MRIRKRRGCVRCGRRIVVRRPKRHGLVYIPRGSDHDLCQRCWKAEQDRMRVSG